MRLLYVLLMAVMLAACRGQGAEISCTVSVYDDEGNVILSETEVVCTEGQSVLDVIKKATKDAGVQMEYTGSGATAYIQGIDNLYEFDKGPESGWIYSVNGDVKQESAGVCPLLDGDTIIWQYVLTP